jgi:hypothetical protein
VKYGGNVKFPVITDDYLFIFADWMKKLGNSKSSTGIYLRALRSVFNEDSNFIGLATRSG